MYALAVDWMVSWRDHKLTSGGALLHEAQWGHCEFKWPGVLLANAQLSMAFVMQGTSMRFDLYTEQAELPSVCGPRWLNGGCDRLAIHQVYREDVYSCLI